MNSYFHSKTIEEKVKLIRKCGIEVIGFFMIGYPTETVADINKTINLDSLSYTERHRGNTFPMPWE